MSIQPGRLPYLRNLPKDTDFTAGLVGAPIVAFGVRIGILTDRPELLGTLLSLAPPGSKISARPGVDRMFTVLAGNAGLVKGGRTPHLLIEDRAETARYRDLASVLDLFERQMKMYVAEHAVKRVFVHAGAIGWKGKAILVPGRSYTGKSTLIAEMVKAGAVYYSDEYAVIDARGFLHPYPVPLSIRDPRTSRQARVEVERLGGRTGVKPLPIGLIVVTTYKEGSCWRPRGLTSGQAVLELLDNTLPARSRPEFVLPALRNAVSGAIALKGPRGDAAATAADILSAEA